LKSVNNNKDYTYKLKNIGLGSLLRCLSWALKKPESLIISKMSLKMGNIRLSLVITTKI
jgi:hypothetical protein